MKLRKLEVMSEVEKDTGQHNLIMIINS